MDSRGSKSHPMIFFIQFSDSMKNPIFWLRGKLLPRLHSASSENSSSTSLRGCHFRKETNHGDGPFHPGPNLQNSKSSLWKYRGCWRNMEKPCILQGIEAKLPYVCSLFFETVLLIGADWCWLLFDIGEIHQGLLYCILK